jgi:hypothetical protein
MKMRINNTDGVVSFSSGSIGAAGDRADFLKSSLGQTVKSEKVRGTRYQYVFDPEPGISATAFFDGERLNRVFLMMSVPSDAECRWTEALELERKAKHDHWLAQELGNAPYLYNWGSITSDFDPRGCSSEIIIVYDR